MSESGLEPDRLAVISGGITPGFARQWCTVPGGEIHSDVYKGELYAKNEQNDRHRCFGQPASGRLCASGGHERTGQNTSGDIGDRSGSGRDGCAEHAGEDRRHEVAL